MGTALWDIIAAVAIAAFAWSGYTIGLSRALPRLAASVVSVLVAAALLPPLRAILCHLGVERDVASFLALVVVGVTVYTGVRQLTGALLAGRELSLDYLRGADQLATVSGAVVGAGWTMLILTLVALVPSGVWPVWAALHAAPTRAALAVTPFAVHGVAGGFPHATQTLPKGDAGALVHSQDNLPLHGDRAHSRPEEARVLLANVNEYRFEHGQIAGAAATSDGAASTHVSTALALQADPDLDAVAAQWGQAMLRQRTLGSNLPDGSSLTERVHAALGVNAAASDIVGALTVWTHSTANAYAAVIADPHTHAAIVDAHADEVGIAIVDGGWFNGEMAVLVLIGRHGATLSVAAPREISAPAT